MLFSNSIVRSLGTKLYPYISSSSSSKGYVELFKSQDILNSSRHVVCAELLCSNLEDEAIGSNMEEETLGSNLEEKAM